MSKERKHSIQIGKMRISLVPRQESYILFYLASKGKSVSIENPEDAEKLSLWLSMMAKEMRKINKEKK